MRRIAIIVAITAGSLGSFAAVAGATPSGTLCGSVHVVVNGQDVVNRSTCQAIPPQS